MIAISWLAALDARAESAASPALSLVSSPAPALVSEAVPATWQRHDLRVRPSAEPHRVARSIQGDVAIGDASGVSWQSPPRAIGGAIGGATGGTAQAPRRAVLPPVRALAFDQHSVLWIGTLEGLYRWEREGRPIRRALQGAAGSPEIRDLVTSGSVLLLATATGAYWSTAGRIFQPLDGAGVSSAIRRVLLRGAGGQTIGPAGLIRPGGVAEAWLLGANELIRIWGLVTTSGLRVVGRERVGLSRPASERSALALVLNPAETELALVYPDAVATRTLEAVAEAGGATVAWRMLRPVLAPGAEIRALAWTSEGAMLATDHGVFVSPGLAGPYTRTPSPVGHADCRDLAAAPPVLALCRSGLFAFERVSPFVGRPGDDAALAAGTPVAPPVRPNRASSLADDPPVEEIRRRALRRSGLDAARASRLWSGLRQRARWPELSLRFGVELDEADARDHDQSFLSGDTRYLFDRARDRDRRIDATVVLDWDLGGLVYPLESVDLSRELRQVVSLRDDIADEINQLYFERQRLRETLEAAVPMEPGEAARLFWRAREIDAGLDAWTGGWVSRWRVDPLAASREAVPPWTVLRRSWLSRSGEPSARERFEPRNPGPRFDRRK